MVRMLSGTGRQNANGLQKRGELKRGSGDSGVVENFITRDEVL